MKIFCTFIEADVEQKMSDACMARAKRFAWLSYVESGKDEGVRKF